MSSLFCHGRVIVGVMTGSGDMHLVNNLRHHLHGGGGSKKDQHQQPHIPKGCLTVMVGQEGEQQERFVVPVAYLTHPRFMQLLKEAEDVYGFDHKGAVAIPCQVKEFGFVQGLIERELFPTLLDCRGGGHHHHNIVGCFRA